MIIIKKALKKLLLRGGVVISKIDSDNYFFLQSFLYHHLKKNKNFFFVQIGANDGITWDPIYQFITRHHDKIKGILIEPMKDAFEQLVQNYKKYPNILKLNVAIHNSEKEMTLYKADSRIKLPEWSKGIASFDKDFHKLSGLQSDCIITEKVKCISFDELLEKYNLIKIDYLQIDTEGYDAEIILNINFEIIKPSVIRFEHDIEYGIMSKETLLKVVRHLNINGYQVIIEKRDATAYQPLFDL